MSNFRTSVCRFLSLKRLCLLDFLFALNFFSPYKAPLNTKIDERVPSLRILFAGRVVHPLLNRTFLLSQVTLTNIKEQHRRKSSKGVLDCRCMRWQWLGCEQSYPFYVRSRAQSGGKIMQIRLVNKPAFHAGSGFAAR